MSQDAIRERALVVGLLRSTADGLLESVSAGGEPRTLGRWLSEYVGYAVAGLAAGILRQVAERIERGEHLAAPDAPDPLAAVRVELSPHAFQGMEEDGTCTFPWCGRLADHPIHEEPGT